MRVLLLMAILLSLLPLGALGHDLYRSYYVPEKEELDLSKPFLMSDVGWIWNVYDAGSYRDFRRSFDEETWQQWLRPAMESRTVIVTGLPPLILFAIYFVLRVMRSGIMAAMKIRMGAGRPAVEKREFTTGGSKKAPLKYKRK